MRVQNEQAAGHWPDFLDDPHCAGDVKMIQKPEAQHNIIAFVGDVRDSVSGEEGVAPTAAAKHTTEHPPCHSELRRLRVYRWPLRS